MRKIPIKLREELSQLPQVCARRSKECNGRITWEHVWIYSGRQINELWAIIFLCWYHHLEKGLDKRENERISLEQATEEELAKYPNRDWKKLKQKLNP